MTIRFHAIAEAPWFEGAPPFPWRLGTIAPFSTIVLHGDVSQETVGSVMASLCARVEEGIDARALDVADCLDAVLADEHLILGGGIRVIGASGVEVAPGCCCGVETWREWAAMLATGQSPWLGHDPSPGIEQRESGFRIWKDARETAYVDCSRAEYVAGLRSVQRDLVGFLARLDDWARDIGFPRPRAAALVERVDEALEIRRPLVLVG